MRPCFYIEDVKHSATSVLESCLVATIPLQNWSFRKREQKDTVSNELLI